MLHRFSYNKDELIIELDLLMYNMQQKINIYCENTLILYKNKFTPLIGATSQYSLDINR